MMMKKTLIAMAILGSTAFISSVQAADGTVNFTGNITDAACTITPTTASQTVALGTVSNKAFSSSSNSASATRFGITLSTCPAAMKTAEVKFSGLADNTNSNLLALTAATGVATGIGVGIYEEDGTTLIPLNTKSATKTLSSTANTTFNFIAKYVATATTVTAGSANAVSDFTITYN